MVSMRDKDAKLVIEKTAEALKDKIQQPEWSKFVKTGISRDRVPQQKDWWYLRSASLMRRIYIDGPVGVSRLRSVYGGKHRRGHKPAHFAKSGGKIIRTIFQDLEKIGYVEKVEKPKKGRVLSKEGMKFMNEIAKQI